MPVQIQSKPLMIAHAGGGIDGYRYTNSLEALDANYAVGFRFFEVDFSWTSDNQLVCLHDWGNRFQLNFGYQVKQALSLKQFQDVLDFQVDRHPCTLETLANWLSSHPDCTIITDVKHHNIEAIQLMARQYQHISQNLIPQFYQPEEYKVLRDLGFVRLIWILYQFEGKKKDVPELAKDMDLFAISMRAAQAKKKWAQRLILNNQSVFVYTINSRKKLLELTQEYAVSGIYTDFLPAFPQ